MFDENKGSSLTFVSEKKKNESFALTISGWTTRDSRDTSSDPVGTKEYPLVIKHDNWKVIPTQKKHRQKQLFTIDKGKFPHSMDVDFSRSGKPLQSGAP